MSADAIYDFVFRGILTEEALDRAGRTPRLATGYLDPSVAKAISLDLLEPSLVETARPMATVYMAIAAFENSVRALVTNVLIDEVGSEWWMKSVSERIRKKAEGRRTEEEAIKWHTRRGDNPINYTDLSDLALIIQNSWVHFEPYLQSVEWVKSIFDSVERSRNVIMHSGFLDLDDIERIGINIRDWIRQVGA